MSELVAQIDAQRTRIDQGADALSLQFRERTDVATRARNLATRFVQDHPLATVAAATAVGLAAARFLRPPRSRRPEKTASHPKHSTLRVGSLFGALGKAAFMAALPAVESAIRDRLATHTRAPSGDSPAARPANPAPRRD